MPKFENAPDEMNSLMESAYASCMKDKGDEARCSKIAIGAAKKAGFYKSGKNWKKMKSKRIG